MRGKVTEKSVTLTSSTYFYYRQDLSKDYSLDRQPQQCTQSLGQLIEEESPTAQSCCLPALQGRQLSHLPGRKQMWALHRRAEFRDKGQSSYHGDIMLPPWTRGSRRGDGTENCSRWAFREDGSVSLPGPRRNCVFGQLQILWFY